MNMLIGLIKIPFLNTLIQHEVNNHTGSTAVLLVMGLSSIGWLPEGASSYVNGQSNNLIIGICLLVIGLRLLLQFHMQPLTNKLFKPKLAKLQDELDCLKVEQQIAEVKGNINENK